MNRLLLITAALCALCIPRCGIAPLSGSGGSETEGRIMALYGTVVFEDEAPAAGALVSIRTSEQVDSRYAQQALVAITDQEGAYRIDSLVPGRYLLSVVSRVSDREGSAVLDIALDADVRSGKQNAPRAILMPPGRIAGTIGSFSPHAGITVEVLLIYNGFQVARTVVDSGGRFGFAAVPAARYSLSFHPSCTTYASFVRQDVAVTASETVELFLGGLITSRTLASDSGYTQDSLAVMAILAANGLSKPVSSITTVNEHNRIAKLHLGRQGLVVLPCDVQRLNALHTLEINDNRLATLPDCFDALARLRVLNADNNQLRSLPSTLSTLDSLVVLRLAGNRLDSLPAFLGELVSLVEFSAADNQLTSLPASIANLVNLRVCALQNNALITLPQTIGECRSLVTLTLQNNLLDSLPASLVRLSNLERLSVRNNRLSLLPELLGSLRSLDLLWLENNRIAALPPSIGELHSLRFLVVTGNMLRRLPDELGGLSELVELSLDSNFLEDLPASVVNLEKLEVVNLRGNRLCSPGEPVQEWLSSFDARWSQFQHCTADDQFAIRVTSPGAGDRMVAGQVVRIGWETRPVYGGGDLAVTIDLSVDNGETWLPVIGSPITIKDPRWGNFSWTVPDSLPRSDAEMVPLLSDSCLVRVSDYFDPYYHAFSPGPFAIISSAITITDPSGGELLYQGDTLVLGWTGIEEWILSVDWYLSVDNGENWYLMNQGGALSSTDDRWGRMEWVIPDSISTGEPNGWISTAGDSCFVRVGDYIGCAFDNCHQDQTTRPFTIRERVR